MAAPERFDRSFRTRLAFAFVAGLLWWPIISLGDTVPDWLGSVLRYGTGSVFAVCVLVPYLDRADRFFHLRAIALLLAGALSYWLGVNVAVGDLELTPFRYVAGEPLRTVYVVAVGGFYGVVAVGAAARLIIPLRLSMRDAFYLTGVGIIGGICVGIGVAFDDDQYAFWAPGHVIWQVLVCIALYRSVGARAPTGR